MRREEQYGAGGSGLVGLKKRAGCSRTGRRLLGLHACGTESLFKKERGSSHKLILFVLWKEGVTFMVGLSSLGLS